MHQSGVFLSFFASLLSPVFLRPLRLFFQASPVQADVPERWQERTQSPVHRRSQTPETRHNKPPVCRRNNTPKVARVPRGGRFACSERPCAGAPIQHGRRDQESRSVEVRTRRAQHCSPREAKVLGATELRANMERLTGTDHLNPNPICQDEREKPVSLFTPL